MTSLLDSNPKPPIDFKKLGKICRSGSVTILQTLVPEKISPNAKIPFYKILNSPRFNIPILCVSAAYGSLECVKCLLSAGANIDDSDNMTYSPLHWAVISGHHLIVGYLLQKKANPNLSLISPLWLAARYGRPESAGLLLECGANIHVRDSSGRTPLMVAAWFGHFDIVKLLIAKGAPIDVVDLEERSTLHLASWFGHFQIVEFLVNRSSTFINSRDKNANTPLHFACQHNYKQIVEKLLIAGADPKLKNKADQTPQQLAEAEDRQEVIELLQKKAGEKSKNRILNSQADLNMFQEQKSMNEELEKIVSDEEVQLNIIQTILERLDQQSEFLMMLTGAHNELKRQLDDMEFTTKSLVDRIRPHSNLPNTISSRFTISSVKH